MLNDSPDDRSNAHHNDKQRGYFARADQPTIQPSRSSYVLRHLEETLSAAKLNADDKILEVGAGVGRFTSLIYERTHNVVASDLSAELLQSLEKNVSGVDTLICDINNLPACTEQRFDVVLGFYILHHLEDLQQTFNSVAQVLYPGGRVVFCEPNAYYFPFYLQILLTPGMRWKVDKGVKNMRPSVVIPAMRRAGFMTTTIHRYGFLPPQLHRFSTMRQIESWLESISVLQPMRAFQIFTGRLLT
jgi:ubiquinone/menaquinone biosynthesis C-methylase UbiE